MEKYEDPIVGPCGQSRGVGVSSLELWLQWVGSSVLDQQVTEGTGAGTPHNKPHHEKTPDPREQSREGCCSGVQHSQTVSQTLAGWGT